MRGVILAPYARNPTQSSSKDDLPASLWNKPQDKGVIKPALRHTSGDEQEPRIDISEPQEGDGYKWTREHQQGDKSRVSPDVPNPEGNPTWHHHEAGDRDDEAK